MEDEIINNKSIVVFVLAFIILLGIVIVGLSYATLLDNDVEVEKDSKLTYYLEVSYDGVDKLGVTSSDSVTAEVNSGIIYIEDKIPEGLTFTGFVTTADGSIGAYKRSDNTSCLGKVIDDTNEESANNGTWNDSNTEYTYHGLHYTTVDRTVRFRVRNLKAGCALTVGIKTRTPETIDDPETEFVETRRDFYNFGSSRENALTVNSNITHAFMGKENITTYSVKYEYTGTVPSNAPAVPVETKYAENASVGVASNPVLDGYTFSGWTTSDASISNKLFIMPNKTVTLKGSFTAINAYKVTYSLIGITPTDYVLPKEKEYYSGNLISLDSLKEGDVFNGYRFLGWSTNDVTINNNEFTMPSSNVVITGEFEEVKYKVQYKFYDSILPNNSDTLLPETKSYAPDTIVTLDSNDIVASGYEFLGWYKENEFVMPEEDIIIYGEWKKVNGTFTPSLTSTINSGNNYYKVGDTIRFKITVKNNESFAIRDVIIKKNNIDANIESGSNYNIETDEYVKIPSIGAGASVDVYMTYIVSSTDNNTIFNEVELTGAVGNNDYVLSSGERKVSSTANLASKLSICEKISGSDVGNIFQFKISNTIYESYINLKKDECKTLYVSPGTYKIMEIVPQEYEIKKIEGSIASNEANLTINQGTNYEITYTNEFKKKGFLHSFGRAVNQVLGGN